ncbi:MAG: hypothetical protein EOM65_04950 [Synergistales bacterium]|nr:hypothetical protein [Synergistales bacterium]
MMNAHSITKDQMDALLLADKDKRDSMLSHYGEMSENRRRLKEVGLPDGIDQNDAAAVAAFVAKEREKRKAALKDDYLTRYLESEPTYALLSDDEKDTVERVCLMNISQFSGARQRGCVMKAPGVFGCGAILRMWPSADCRYDMRTSRGGEEMLTGYEFIVVMMRWNAMAGAWESGLMVGGTYTNLLIGDVRYLNIERAAYVIWPERLWTFAVTEMTEAIQISLPSLHFMKIDGMGGAFHSKVTDDYLEDELFKTDLVGPGIDAVGMARIRQANEAPHDDLGIRTNVSYMTMAECVKYLGQKGELPTDINVVPYDTPLRFNIGCRVLFARKRTVPEEEGDYWARKRERVNDFKDASGEPGRKKGDHAINLDNAKPDFDGLEKKSEKFLRYNGAEWEAKYAALRQKKEMQMNDGSRRTFGNSAPRGAMPTKAEKDVERERKKAAERAAAEEKEKRKAAERREKEEAEWRKGILDIAVKATDSASGKSHDAREDYEEYLKDKTKEEKRIGGNAMYKASLDPSIQPDDWYAIAKDAIEKFRRHNGAVLKKSGDNLASTGNFIVKPLRAKKVAASKKAKGGASEGLIYGSMMDILMEDAMADGELMDALLEEGLLDDIR